MQINEVVHVGKDSCRFIYKIEFWAGISFLSETRELLASYPMAMAL